MLLISTIITGTASVNSETMRNARSEIREITSLCAKNQPLGRRDYYFNAGEETPGFPLLVPVIVIKGKKSGPNLLITAALHGDELNGIGVIHKLARSIDPDTLSGTLILVPGVNQPGIIAHSRFFQSPEAGRTQDGTLASPQRDLNRLMPGGNFPPSSAAIFASRLWHDLFQPNADLVIDIHTQSKGVTYPLFVFADFRNAVARQMAEDLQPDVIKNDPGESGTLETSFIANNIPAITLEVGAPKMFQKTLIDRAVDGIHNIMINQGLLDSAAKTPTQKIYTKPYIGQITTNITAKRGGLAIIEVNLLDKVKKGQLLARVLDPFGHELDRYVSPSDGIVLAHSTDPLREPSSLLVRILK